MLIPTIILQIPGLENGCLLTFLSPCDGTEVRTPVLIRTCGRALSECSEQIASYCLCEQNASQQQHELSEWGVTW